MNIPLSAPDITEAEIEGVSQVLRSGRLSLGPKLDEFERAMSQYVGVPHAVGVSSGMAGLHLCIRALNIGEGDEVIVFGNELSVNQLAHWAQTIPYEILTGVSQRVRRVYFEE